MVGTERPVLSVVVAYVSDTAGSHGDLSVLADCLTALAKQKDAPPLEIIVPTHDGMSGIEDLKRKFPTVAFVPVVGLQMASRPGGSREHHDVLRARGLSVAQGDLVALIEDNGCPDEHWCARLAAALRSGYAAIGGAMENKVDRPLNWAVYFCDFGKYQNPLPAGPSSMASDANVAYRRSALESIRATWNDSFREVHVNGALISKGERVGLAPDAIVYQNRAKLRFGPALRERFVWGRSYAATRTAAASMSQRLVYAAFSPLLPVILLARMTRTARQKRRLFGPFVRALPFTAMLVTVWSMGEGVGYLAGLSSRPADGQP